MAKKHSEALLEDAIEYSLLHEGGLTRGHSQGFDRTRAQEATSAPDFIQRTQVKPW